MIGPGEKERIELLLKETLTMLCKNGLPYDNKFNIQALIGITLDDSDVLLISLNEFIQGQNVMPFPVMLSSASSSRVTRGGRMNRKRKCAPPARPLDHLQPNANMEELQFAQPAAPSKESDSSASSSDADEDGGESVLKEDLGSFNLLDKIKSVVHKTMTTPAPIVGDVQPPTSRGTGSLQPMGMEESERIWKTAIAAQRMYRAPAGEVKASKKKKKDDLDLTEHAEGTEYPNVSKAPPMCHICGITVTCEKNLTKHVRRHLGMFTYNCDECGKGYFSRPDLDAHTASTHQHVKMFQCHFCGRSYSQKRGLNKHVKQFHGNMGKHGLAAGSDELEAPVYGMDSEVASIQDPGGLVGTPPQMVDRAPQMVDQAPQMVDRAPQMVDRAPQNMMTHGDVPHCSMPSLQHDVGQIRDKPVTGLSQSSPTVRAAQEHKQHGSLPMSAGNHSNHPSNLSHHAAISHLDVSRLTPHDERTNLSHSHLDLSRHTPHEERADIHVSQSQHQQVVQISDLSLPHQSLPHLALPITSSHQSSHFPQGMLPLPSGFPLPSVAHSGMPLPVSVPPGSLYQLPPGLPHPGHHQSPYL